MGGLRIGGDAIRGRRVRFRVDGVEIEAFAGESVAAALLAAGIRTVRRAPVDGGPRGAFCLMGLCQECVVVAEGRAVEACCLAVRDGLEILTGR
jgi:predicted molibdopterin-dependent oxidoreductase YjgC